jgi:glycosyltransferase involved in cell wall biosynthesis
MTEPLVSVVVPCHNAGRWLSETLESALAQTWPRTEIVVVDDGSTDDSRSVVARYPVRLVAQPRRGPSAARNAGVAVAAGEVIQFLDADDVLHPEKIARQMDRLRASPTALALAAQGKFPGAQRDRVVFPALATARDWDDPVDFVTAVLATGDMAATTAWLVPRALVERAGPWARSLTSTEDAEYLVRLALAASRIVFCERALVYHRKYPGSLSTLDTPASRRCRLRAMTRCTRLLLSRRDTAASRQAAARYFTQLAYAYYPHAMVFSRLAERRCRALAVPPLEPEMGPRRRRLARLIGWRAASRVALGVRFLRGLVGLRERPADGPR